METPERWIFLACSREQQRKRHSDTSGEMIDSDGTRKEREGGDNMRDTTRVAKRRSAVRCEEEDEERRETETSRRAVGVSRCPLALPHIFPRYAGKNIPLTSVHAVRCSPALCCRESRTLTS